MCSTSGVEMQHLPGAVDMIVMHSGDLRIETIYSIEDSRRMPYSHKENQIISYSIKASLVRPVKQLEFRTAHFRSVGWVVSKRFHAPRLWGEEK